MTTKNLLRFAGALIVIAGLAAWFSLSPVKVSQEADAVVQEKTADEFTQVCRHNQSCVFVIYTV